MIWKIHACFVDCLCHLLQVQIKTGRIYHVEMTSGGWAGQVSDAEYHHSSLTDRSQHDTGEDWARRHLVEEINNTQ